MEIKSNSKFKYNNLHVLSTFLNQLTKNLILLTMIIFLMVFIK